jgi:hypothetical protein
MQRQSLPPSPIISYVLRRPSIPHKLIHKALAGGHNSALMPQPRQRDRHFLPIAAAHSIGYHVYFVAGTEEIECCLSDADMAFDADDDAGEGAGDVEGIKGSFHFRSSVITSVSYCLRNCWMIDDRCTYIIENSVLSW